MSTYLTPGPILKEQEFTFSSTWTAPEGVRSVYVFAFGGGGGGGRASSGGSGGAGAKPFTREIEVTPGTTYNITIGSGGSGETASLTATDGGVTSFGSEVWRGGQAARADGSFSNPGQGSGASGGRAGRQGDWSEYAQGGSAGSGSGSGGGGGSSFGSGGTGGDGSPSPTNGSDGGLGAGGGGAGTGAASGGNGGNGYMKIFWYEVGQETARIPQPITKEEHFTSNGSWTAPGGVNYVYIRACGGGGGGGNGGGSGGAGAAVEWRVVQVNEGQTYTVTIGSGGAAQTDGTDTTFGSAATFKGGQGAGNSLQSAGLGSGSKGGGFDDGSIPRGADSVFASGGSSTGGVAFGGGAGLEAGGDGASSSGANGSDGGVGAGGGGGGPSGGTGGSGGRGDLIVRWFEI